MSLNHKTKVGDDAQIQRLAALENDGNQALKVLVEGDFITSLSSFYMMQLPTGLVSVAVLADSRQAGDSLWFDEIYSPEDSIQLVEKLVLGLQAKNEDDKERILSLGRNAVKWLGDKSEHKLPFKVIEGINQDVGTILGFLRDEEE